MGYAVELRLDEQDCRGLREAFRATDSLMERVGATPHISLAGFDKVDPSRLIPVVEAFAGRAAPFTVCLSAIGMFPGAMNVVFLAPVVTKELLAIHADLHARLSAVGVAGDSRYAPGNWVPHCTVSLEEPLERALATIRYVQAHGLLGIYHIREVHVIEYLPLASLAGFALTGR